MLKTIVISALILGASACAPKMTRPEALQYCRTEANHSCTNDDRAALYARCLHRVGHGSAVSGRPDCGISGLRCR